MGRESVVAQRGSNADELVRRDRRADTASAHEDAAVGSPTDDCARDALREVGIIVLWVELERAAVDGFMAGVANRVRDCFLERKSRMVAADRNFHEHPRERW